jgi:hypothetical protein
MDNKDEAAGATKRVDDLGSEVPDVALFLLLQSQKRKKVI